MHSNKYRDTFNQDDRFYRLSRLIHRLRSVHAQSDAAALLFICMESNRVVDGTGDCEPWDLNPGPLQRGRGLWHEA